MTEIPQDAEEQIEDAAQAVALGLAKLIAEVMGGKKRISVFSDPVWVRRPDADGEGMFNALAYRHTIEVQDLEIPDCSTTGTP